MANELFERVGRWALSTFPKATLEGTINHLRDEVQNEVHPECDAEELADIVILAIHLATRRGIDLYAEVEKKIAINEARAWPTEPNEDGYFPHIK